MTTGRPDVRTEVHRVADVPTSGASTLRLAFVPDVDDGDVLVISHGFGGAGEPFRRPGWCGSPIRIPASAIPGLVAALEELRGSDHANG